MVGAEGRVTAIVVTWRSAKRAAECLAALRADAPSARVLVVDVESRTSLEPADDVIAITDNVGFAAAVNAGAASAFAAGAPAIVILNDDVVVRPGCLQALLEVADDETCVAPRITGTEPFAGAAIDWRRGFGRHIPGARDYLTAACLLIRRAVWERVGPFDESFFLYYEDVDWSLRARAAGVDLLVADGAVAEHTGGASSGGATGSIWGYYATRNRLRFLHDRRGRRAFLLEVLRSALTYTGALAIGRHPALQIARLRGLSDAVRGRRGRGPYP